MSSHGKGDLSAATQVKVLSLKTFIIARGQAFHFTEAGMELRVKGERDYGMPGSESVAGKSNVMSELGRSNRFSGNEYCAEAGEATRRNDRLEVGLAHSRGVAIGNNSEEISLHLKGLAEECCEKACTVPFTVADIRQVRTQLT